MLLAADNTVEARPITTGVMQGGRWQVTEGLKAGDKVIVSSLAALTPGTTVVPRAESAQAPEDAEQPKAQ